MCRIFISYKRVDKKRVFEIKREIEKRTGQDCWIDIDGIESDAQFVSVIMRAINTCELFLFMYSKEHSKITNYEQDWTVREIMFAQNKKKRIVFINIDGTELTDWFEFMFGTKQQVNILDDNVPERLYSDIANWLSEETSTKADPYIQNGKIGFVNNIQGDIVVSCKYEDAGNFSEGLAVVKLNGKWGYIDKLGHEVIPCKYDEACDFSEDLAVVVLGGCGYVDKLGHEVIPCKYDEAHGFSEGLAVVAFGNKWGYVDKLGHEVIPCKYDDAYDFSEGLTIVKLNGKWGYIDKFGHEVFPCKYDEACDFSEGLAVVKLNGKWGYFVKLNGK